MGRFKGIRGFMGFIGLHIGALITTIGFWGGFL